MAILRDVKVRITADGSEFSGDAPHHVVGAMLAADPWVPGEARDLGGYVDLLVARAARWGHGLRVPAGSPKLRAAWLLRAMLDAGLAELVEP